MARHTVDGFRLEVTARRGVPRRLTQAEVAAVVARALEAAGAPAGSSIAVILTDDAEIAGLNERHLGHEGPTDVLSFPLLPPDAFPPHEGGAAPVAGHSTPFVLPPGAPAHLGDIVVSVARAIEQAAEGRGGQTGDVRWDAASELRLLLTHGALHVCGWDHAEPVEEAAMRALERLLLEAGWEE